MFTPQRVAVYEGAGGGGCFPAGTQVNTPDGYKNIEDLVVGDSVYAFDLRSFEPGEIELPGRIFIKKITQTFKHDFGEVGYTSPLMVITHEKGAFNVTGNHYILVKDKTGAAPAEHGFARVDELEVGDVLYTEHGVETTILEIQAGEEYDFVYNLEVEDLHTYIAGKIRVHNGGGGKSQHTPVQAPNSIRTNQLARVLYGIGEGENVGLWDSVNPAKSVFFDKTPIQEPDGSFNYTNVVVEQRYGLPDQTAINGFSAVESEFVVNQNVTTAVPVTKAISSSAIDSARVTLAFPNGLQSIDTKSGDANGTSVNFKISTRIAAGTWSVALNITVREMSSGPFTVAYRVPRPGAAGNWEFKVERVTADSSSNNLINTLQLKSYTEIDEVLITYPDVGLVGLTVGAESTNNQIPTMSVDWGGVKLQVPNNYNPTTRAYTGSWSGTFAGTRQWTDNPAWVLYDLITNTRYGLGNKIALSQIDKFNFYAAAQYCDELIDNGKGTGTFEPRFTFNAQLMVFEDAWKTLSTIAATFNSNVYIHDGYVRVSQDRPMAPTKSISNSNVIGGNFTYSYSDSRSRFTSVNATYNDPLDNFLPKTVSEKATTAEITRYGFQSTDIAAYGVTSEGEARRAARYMLYTNLRQTEFVEFGVSFEHADFEPGEVFYLMDRDYSQVSQEGKLLSVSGSTITLDRPLTIAAGSTWTITLIGADGVTLETKTITTGASTTSTITISGTTTAIAGGGYIVTGAVAPRQFKMLTMTESAKNQYNVKAVWHNPGKYAFIEQGIILPLPVFWTQPNLASADAPTNLVLTAQTTTTPENSIIRYINASWTPPADHSAASYRVSWSKDGQPMSSQANILMPYFRFEASVGGTYDVFVNAINAAGIASPTLVNSFTLDIDPLTGAGTSGVGAPANVRLITGGTTFGTSTMNVTWDAPTLGSTVLKDYEVQLQVPFGAVFKTFYTNTNSFSYTYEQNVADGGPRPSIQVNVRARDTFNKTSGAATNTFNSAGGSSIVGLQVRGGGTTFNTLDLEFEWSSLTGSGGDYTNDPSFGYYKVEILSGTTVKRTEQVYQPRATYTFSNNVKDNGQDTPLANIGVRITAYNKFSVAGATGSATFTPAAPPTATNLTVQGKGAGVTVFDTMDCLVEWACVQAGTNYAASNIFKRYKVEVLKGTTVSRTEYVAPDSKYEYTFANNILDNGQDNPNANIIVRVTAENVYNVGGTSLSVTFTPAPPPACTLLYVVNTTSNTFITNDLEVEWDCITTGGGNFVGNNMFKEFRVRAYNGVTLKRTDIAVVDKYPYDYFKNQLDNGGNAIRNPTIEVAARNIYNVYGTALSGTFTNAAPAAPNVTTTPGVDMIFIDAVRQGADVDVLGYIYHISTTSGFTPTGTVAGSGTCVYAGPNSSITYKVVGGITYYVKVMAYDGFGTSGLNASTQTSGAVSVPITGYDYQFPGFTFSASGNTATWSAGTAAKVAGVGAPASYSVSAGSAGWSGGSVYIFWDEASPTIFQATTSITTATGLQKRIVAVYRGGNDISQSDGKVMIDGTTTIFPGTINSSLLVTGAAVITGEAQMGSLTVNTAAIKDLAVSGAKIGDLSVGSLKLANGSVSDTRFFVSNTSTTLANTSTTGTFNVPSTIVAELAITTPNPTGLNGPFPTYIHASLITNTRINGNVALSNNGSINSSGDSAGQVIQLASNLTVFGTPSWQLRVINSAGTVIAQSDVVLNGSGAKTGTSSISNNGSINSSGTATGNQINLIQNISVSAGAGLNLLFLAPALNANTAYRIQLLVTGALTVPQNSSSTPIALTADQRAIYYQCLLR